MAKVRIAGLFLSCLLWLAASLSACGGGGGQASCSDGTKNGTESDVDCGGSCGKCDLGRDCVSDFDCASGNCIAGTCEPGGSGGCDDGIQNGYETDVDCGGTCPGCQDGEGCLVDADCADGNCADGTCGPGGVTCQDGILNGNETDVDCGGNTCGPCANGSTCAINTDCLSNDCTGGTCQTGGNETCQDGVQNQDETDVDCGGNTCGPCANGSACGLDGDCQSGYCANGTCEAIQDQCPNDPFKTVPGVCGCGAPDIDSDSDGAMDCIDGCPQDPDKTEEGLCGCGVPDGGDADGDGTPDCIDGCPQDPGKIAPGLCGCGAAETDSDGDGSPDCIDGCPQDPNKTAPGACGCGVVDVDADSDGVPDCVDNCPQVANPGQEDGNGNGIGDACEAQPGCGNDCWGPTGCQTAAGRCIRFTCRAGDQSQNFCASCMGPGWAEISYTDWLNGGYCADVTARYRIDQGTATKCGGAPSCCADPAACAGNDNAWHWWDGANNRYTGPSLGNNDANCLTWDGTDNSTYTRLTACQRTGLSAENGVGNGVTYSYDPGDSVQTRALKACESHFGVGNCCIITGGYQDMQYGECGMDGYAGTIHWHWDNHPAGHCAPDYVIGDVVSPGWCGVILGSFLD